MYYFVLKNLAHGTHCFEWLGIQPARIQGLFLRVFSSNSPCKPIHGWAEDDMFLWLEGKFMHVFHSQSGCGFICC